MNGYLLDTNTISELRKPRRNSAVAAYLATLPSSDVYVSMLSIGELHKGAARKRQTDPAQAHAISQWIEELELHFDGRILGLDLPTARLWGEFSGVGRTRPVVDTLLAATAIHHNLTLVTRNIADFSDLPVTLVDPWQPDRANRSN